MTDDPDRKEREKDIAFIGSAVDQMVASIRDILFKANDKGCGIQLNGEIEAIIDMMQNHENPVNRICGELMQIGHCTVLESMHKSVTPEDA